MSTSWSSSRWPAAAPEAGEDEPDDEVSLAAIVQRAAERTRRRSGRTIVVDADTTLVRGRDQALERAVGICWRTRPSSTAPVPHRSRSPFDAAVSRPLTAGPAWAQTARGVRPFLPRRHRAWAAGSGLGLAIVRDVAEGHDGTVFARTDLVAEL